MALFQRDPNGNNDRTSLFTLGSAKTILVVGLGNVGKDYTDNRHNIGFKCLDSFANASGFGNWMEKKDMQCSVNILNMGETRVILCKPNTMMNLSGNAVQKLMHFYKLSNKQVIVVHDELDVPFGQIRTRNGGGSAGNNGIKSIIQQIGEDFGRVRIGIANDHSKKIDSADFVLTDFSKTEQAQIKYLTQEVNSILTESISAGELPDDTRNFIM